MSLGRRAAALPGRGRRPAAVRRSTPRRAAPSSACSRTPRRSSRGSRSTRRSSTCAGWSTSRARRPRSRRGCGTTSARRSACRSRSASRGRSSSRRSRAASRSPTACSSSRPTASSRSSTRCRSSGSGASARRRPRSSTAAGSRPSARSAFVDEDVLVAILGRASGRHLHALAHNRDPRPVLTGRRRRSIGAQRALGRAPRSPGAVDTALVGLVDRVTRRMRAAGRVGRTVVLRLRFGDFSRATRSHTLPRATAETQAILATARWLLDAAAPTIERRGLTLVGVAVGSLEDDDALQLALPLVARRRRARRRARRDPRRASARPRSRARCCSATTRASSCRCSPTRGRAGGSGARAAAGRGSRRRRAARRGAPARTRGRRRGAARAVASPASSSSRPSPASVRRAATRPPATKNASRRAGLERRARAGSSSSRRSRSSRRSSSSTRSSDAIRSRSRAGLLVAEAVGEVAHPRLEPRERPAVEQVVELLLGAAGERPRRALGATRAVAERPVARTTSLLATTSSPWRRR